MNVRDLFKNFGLKVTLQRRVVYEIMQDLHHASIDDVIKRVHVENPDITDSTVYRILDSFCNVGLLSRMNHPNGKCYFDINSSEHHHILSADGKVADYNNLKLVELIKAELKEEGFNILEIDKITINIFTK